MTGLSGSRLVDVHKNWDYRTFVRGSEALRAGTESRVNGESEDEFPPECSRKDLENAAPDDFEGQFDADYGLEVPTTSE